MKVHPAKIQLAAVSALICFGLPLPSIVARFAVHDFEDAVNVYEGRLFMLEQLRSCLDSPRPSALRADVLKCCQNICADLKKSELRIWNYHACAALRARRFGVFGPATLIENIDQLELRALSCVAKRDALEVNIPER